MIGLLLAHGLTYVLGHWSAKLRAFIAFSSIRNLNEETLKKASHVMVCYKKKDGGIVHEICSLEKETTSLNVNDPPQYFFAFQKKKYNYSHEEKKFLPLKSPTKLPISEYFRDDYAQKDKFGSNGMDIPMPKFFDLLKDQMMEPFSFFQFFSVAL